VAAIAMATAAAAAGIATEWHAGTVHCAPRRPVPARLLALDFLRHGAKLTTRQPTDGGVCDDCTHTVAVRWTFGRVTVCRRCVLSRMGAAAAITRAEPGLDVSERSQVAREYAALEQLGKDEETKP